LYARQQRAVKRILGGCNHIGHVTPHGTTGVFDLTLVNGCLPPSSPAQTGVVIFDAARAQVTVMAPLHDDDMVLAFGTRHYALLRRDRRLNDPAIDLELVADERPELRYRHGHRLGAQMVFIGRGARLKGLRYKRRTQLDECALRLPAIRTLCQCS
jgi:hypothetical protein